jgi:hypothetical protein
MSIVVGLSAKAKEAAQSFLDQNHIRIDMQPDRRSVILTTHVNGRDEAWITFDAEQLDELTSSSSSPRRLKCRP